MSSCMLSFPQILILNIMPRSQHHDDEGVIDLRTKDDEPEFRINRVPEEREPGQRPQQVPDQVSVTPLASGEYAAMKPHDKVKVKFDKFVNLIATHAYQEIFDKHLDDDVIISTDLLTDLANSEEEKSDSKKIPAFFIIGIVIGVLVTWLLLRTNA